MRTRQKKRFGAAYELARRGAGLRADWQQDVRSTQRPWNSHGEEVHSKPTTTLVPQPQLVCEDSALWAIPRRLKRRPLLAFTLWLTVGWLPNGVSTEASTNGTSSTIVVIQNVVVDGQPQQISERMLSSSKSPRGIGSGENTVTDRLRISSSAERLEFRFGPNTALPTSAVRLRYQLEGYDKEWREAGGEMRLNVRFLDSAANTVSAQDFLVKGESGGWSGSLLGSRFNRRREEVQAPDRAVKIQLELFSGGPEQTVGIMVIDDLTVSVAGATNGNPETLLFSLHLTGDQDLDQPLAVPRGWMRDGSKPTIALLLRSDDYPAVHFLAVKDTDPNTWGAWRTDPNSSIAVHPHDSLILRWNEMYSIGWGGPGEAGYSYLPPGQYRFRVQAVTEMGESTGAMVSLPITVVPPFWQTPWFRGSVFVLVLGALVAAARYATWRKMRLRIELLDQQRALELERTRIARDIHDDLGANLTQIALLSELAQTDLDQPAQARSHLQQIFTTAGAVARQLDEIVWAITPANDNLEQFVSYMSKYAQDYLRVAGIRCRLEVPESLPEYPMSSAERHDLFLAAKEALHNAVKHAHADQVWLRLKVQEGALVLVIEDNGKGFREPVGTVKTGHGLANMRKRLNHIGGTFEQQSEVGLGTSVRLVLPLNQR